MDPASVADEPRERAISSEPCSTRPNPFDDSDISSRKRRRTSMIGTSHSQSADTTNSFQRSSPVGGQTTAEPVDDPTMRIEADPASPHTPNQERSESPPRSSRVTLNVRTPSRALEATLSTPPSPNSLVAVLGQNSMDEAVVESLPPQDATTDTPILVASDPSSPAVEVVTGSSEPDTTFVAGLPPVTLIPGPDAALEDPSLSYELCQPPEAFPDTLHRLYPFFFNHETVPLTLVTWIESYLQYTASVPYELATQSFKEHRDIWTSLPDLVVSLTSRRPIFPREITSRNPVFAFFRSFARLTAYWIDYDVKGLRTRAAADLSPADLPSLIYIPALSGLARSDDMLATDARGYVINHTDDGMSYAAEVQKILEEFQAFHPNSGGSFALLAYLAQKLIESSPRQSRIADGLGHVAVLAAHITRDSSLRLHDPRSWPRSRANLCRGYHLFKDIATALGHMIDRYINYLTPDAATNLISGAHDLYLDALGAGDVVPSDVLKEHAEAYPHVGPSLLGQAMATRWKFTTFSKLIMSSQMQLRVMAATTMCSNLVQLWKMYGDGGRGEADMTYIRYISDFLVRTGLVSYILGPTCHPEITLESSNIIGFLLVSRAYSNEHTDALWQTVTTTQDPRISDALMRMTIRIANLFPVEALLYLCEKLNTVPVDAFNLGVREFCDTLFSNFKAKPNHETMATHFAPRALCIRLIRQSSVFGQQSAIAYPEVRDFAMNKLKDMFANGSSPEARLAMYPECMKDIAERTPTTLGSLSVIHLLVKLHVAGEIRFLEAEFGITRLLVDELEAAIPAARQAGFTAVLSGLHNVPRKELLSCIVAHESSAIKGELGRRLWDLLVGNGASCHEDRDAAWSILNAALNRPTKCNNTFISACFSDYLPSLASAHFRLGTLEFLRGVILPSVNDPASILLDDEGCAEYAGIEQLWRMILTAPDPTIERAATDTLVKEIYLGSCSIALFPHARARKVHLALVRRCLNQLSAAAAKLKSSCESTSSGGDDEPMGMVATAEQMHEQKLLFTRSLSVLRQFHGAHSVKKQFSSPDLRLLQLDCPKAIEGESAELKFQSFDGDTQTDVQPLYIGKQNTAGSLLASLRDVTGFETYRVYYRGRPFNPQENEICKSLEELQIHDGILLVKREADAPRTVSRLRRGASPVEVEIMSHFEELWECLGMEDKLAQKVFEFLTDLPADENLLASVASPSTSYRDLFPLGQPFRCLYALYAVGKYLARREKEESSSNDKGEQGAATSVPNYPEALCRAMSLIVSAIADREILVHCPTYEVQVHLSAALIDQYLRLLKNKSLPSSASKALDGRHLDRFLDMMALICKSPSEQCDKQLIKCVEAIFASCAASATFWSAFCAYDKTPSLLRDLLLLDSRPLVRDQVADLVVRCVVDPPSTPVEPSFQNFFWPAVTGLVDHAINRPDNGAEILKLCHTLFKALREQRSPILNIKSTVAKWANLLQSYRTVEDVTRPYLVDNNAAHLVGLLHTALCTGSEAPDPDILPKKGLARQLFWIHLFPPFDQRMFDDDIWYQDRLGRPILTEGTRRQLIEILCVLVAQDREQVESMLGSLNRLVPYYLEDDGVETYAYDLSFQFERAKAIRAPCGYVGLKNLGNTCYINSLLTQLFMNVGFRQFMLNAEVRDMHYSQNLLFQTQKLFAFMQCSFQRAITPEDCVNSIKTYDDGQIDVGIQMDVDEFYNLLFDRWEGQMLGAEAKRRFRFLFGGQLVQQVKSQECEHVSERLEPFSAIQCDIKGKSSLEESLLAYVDGEIMQGDNKYKCSTCDRHVDAVKQACLKDIPDNLIFHLKRFEYNLRSQVRSKINDYFAFPKKIDMRPYTVEHLSGEANEAPPDVFELVGVLVHAGNAEAGHYYSYVREWPSTREDEVWVELNDDLVTPWDPSQMESSCFGGPDYRSVDANVVTFDKAWSAYMLFYQRSSSPPKEQRGPPHDNVLGPVTRSPPPQQRGPWQVPLKPDMASYIHRDNMALLRRHCLYDPAQMYFVETMLSHVRALHNGTCSTNHALEDLAIEMALSHYEQVASRTTDIPDVKDFVHFMERFCDSCVRCSISFFAYFSDRHGALRFLVQRNPEAEVRSRTTDMLLHVVDNIKKQRPQQYDYRADDEGRLAWQSALQDDALSLGHTNTIDAMMGCFHFLLEHIHTSSRSWREVFGFMYAFVTRGESELRAYLGEDSFLDNLLLVICADVNVLSELPPKFARLANLLARRTANRPPPAYEELIALLDVLLAECQFSPMEVHGPTRPHLPVAPFYLTPYQAELLTMEWPPKSMGSVFAERLIGINQHADATKSILRTLMLRSRQMESMLCNTLQLNIKGHAAAPQNLPYLSIASSVFCPLASSPEHIQRLLQHVNLQCMSLDNNDGLAFLDFQRAVFAGARDHSGESAADIYFQSLAMLPDWAPGLLTYPRDSSVCDDTELFLTERLFSRDAYPVFDGVDYVEVVEKVREAARGLALRLLYYLRENYLDQGAEMRSSLMGNVDRVLKECSRHFNFEELDEDRGAKEFLELKHAVLEPVVQMVIAEDASEGVSEWEESSLGESLGDVSMHGDMQDADLP